MQWSLSHGSLNVYTFFLTHPVYNSNSETEQVSVIESIRSTIDTLDPDHSYNVVLGNDFNFIKDTVPDSDGGKAC